MTTDRGRGLLRDATAGDLDVLLALERAVFPRPWTAASFRDELARSDRIWLVVEVAGDVVAFGGVADLAGDAHVLTVAVDQDHRRRGHGHALVTALLATARARFATTRATLEVRESNTAARALYRRWGFAEVGVRPGYYQDDGEGAVVLWCHDLDSALHRLDDRPARSTPTRPTRPEEDTP